MLPPIGRLADTGELTEVSLHLLKPTRCIDHTLGRPYYLEDSGQTSVVSEGALSRTSDIQDRLSFALKSGGMILLRRVLPGTSEFLVIRDWACFVRICTASDVEA